MSDLTLNRSSKLPMQTQTESARPVATPPRIDTEPPVPAAPDAASRVRDNWNVDSFTSYDEPTDEPVRRSPPRHTAPVDTSQVARTAAADVVEVNGLKVPVRGATPEELTTIRATLERLPREHVAQIPEIVVGDTAGHGNVGNGGNTPWNTAGNRQHRVELTHSTLRGGRISGALMHEVGHVMSQTRGLSSGVSPRDLGNVTYEGVNNPNHIEGGAPYERFAQAYMMYFRDGDAFRQRDRVAYDTVERALARDAQQYPSLGR